MTLFISTIIIKNQSWLVDDRPEIKSKHMHKQKVLLYCAKTDSSLVKSFVHNYIRELLVRVKFLLFKFKFLLF